jgi:prepilin-type N-terminal cleavage/methylation domain-containing protein
MKASAGFTLLEMLLVLSILGILFALGIPMLRPSYAYVFASDYRAMLQQARFEAIKRNLPVAVVRDGQQYLTLVRNDAVINCTTTNSTQINIKRATEYRDVQISMSDTTGTGNGIVWLPTGLARACDNSAVVTGTAAFISRNITARVRISQGGRVRTL